MISEIAVVPPTSPRLAWAALALALGLVAAALPGGAQEAGEASPWQPVFRKIAGEYRLTAGPERRALTLSPEPLLKWSQPVRGGQDGAVYLWLQDGRPATLGTFFIWPADDGRQGLTHELYALTADRLEGDWRQAIRWRPSTNSLVWQSVPDAAPAPATPAKRAIEARQVARRFSAVSRNREGQTYELRLQPRPFFQYDSPATGRPWLGGALFSIVQGTDTEVVLWLEAQIVDGSPAWRYALARMSDLELTVALDGREVWTTEFARYDDLHGPYLCMSPEYYREPPATDLPAQP